MLIARKLISLGSKILLAFDQLSDTRFSLQIAYLPFGITNYKSMCFLEFSMQTKFINLGNILELYAVPFIVVVRRKLFSALFMYNLNQFLKKIFIHSAHCVGCSSC